MLAFATSLILMSLLCSTPLPNPSSRHLALAERILQKLFSQTTSKAMSIGRNSKAHTTPALVPNLLEPTHSILHVKQHPSALADINVNPQGYSCRHAGASHLSHELAAAGKVSRKPPRNFCAGNLHAPTAPPPHPVRGSIGLLRPCERMRARGPAWRRAARDRAARHASGGSCSRNREPRRQMASRIPIYLNADFYIYQQQQIIQQRRKGYKDESICGSQG
jgi:hypothetical protein